MKAWYEKDFVRKEPIEMTEQQMVALEEIIWASKEATIFAQTAIIYLLRQSAHLTKRVCLSLQPEFDEQLAEEVQNGAHAMNSCNGTTRIDLVFKAMGTEFGLAHHYGSFDICQHALDCCQKDHFDTKRGGRTIWISDMAYDREATLISTDLKAIKATLHTSEYEEQRRKDLVLARKNTMHPLSEVLPDQYIKILQHFNIRLVEQLFEMLEKPQTFHNLALLLNLSAEELAQIRDAIRAKYPDLKITEPEKYSLGLKIDKKLFPKD